VGVLVLLGMSENEDGAKPDEEKKKKAKPRFLQRKPRRCCGKPL
jgi:hypothetical protein